MNKKWIYLLVLLVFIAVTGIRVYQVNANAFAYKDTVHSLKDTFEIKGYTITVNKAHKMSKEEIKKQKEIIPSLSKDIKESDTIVSVNLTVKNNGNPDKKPEKKLIMGQFQLNKGAFVRYAGLSLIQKNNDTHFTLNFIVPKEIVNSKEAFYLAVPIGMWGKEKRDLVKFNI